MLTLLAYFDKVLALGWTCPVLQFGVCCACLCVRFISYIVIYFVVPVDLKGICGELRGECRKRREYE